MLARRTPLRRSVPIRKLSNVYKVKKQLDALVRRIVFRRDGCACLKCGVRKEQGAIIQAAHIYGKGVRPRMRFDPLNVVPLCKSCHFWWHNLGFGQEAAPEADRGVVRAWCIYALGKERMAYLDRRALVTKGRASSPLDLEAVRIDLEQQLAA